MSKLRLNNEKREFLLQKAYELVRPKKQIQAEEKAYQQMLERLKNVVAKLVTEQDLKSLLKFDLAEKNHELAFYVEGVSGQIHNEYITLKKEDALMLPVYCSHWQYHAAFMGTHKIDSPFMKSVLKWKAAVEATNKEEKLNREDVRSLINPARFLEDITPVWEGAEHYRSELDTNKCALSVLSDYKVERIKELVKSA